jgi:hypothetical protein
LAINPTTGEIYVAGILGTGLSYHPSCSGPCAFVARFGSSLDLRGIFCLQALISALAIHPLNGDLYVAGTIQHDGHGTSGSWQPHVAGIWNAFVAQLPPSFGMSSPAPTRLTYLGGSQTDIGTSLAVDGGTGDIFIAGWTNSPDFPVGKGAFEGTISGSTDAFVARLSADLSSLRGSTFFGGSGDENSTSLALNPSARLAYVAGNTTSTDLPATQGAALPAAPDAYNAFVARLDFSLSSGRVTYLGGIGLDRASSVAVIPGSGEVVVSGMTASPDFPAASGGAEPPPNGAECTSSATGQLICPYIGFVARISPDLQSIFQSTRLRGPFEVATSGSFSIYSLAMDYSAALNQLYVGGSAVSLAWTQGGAQPRNAGDADAFIIRMTPDLRAQPLPTPTPTPRPTPTPTPRVRRHLKR